MPQADKLAGCDLSPLFLDRNKRFMILKEMQHMFLFVKTKAFSGLDDVWVVR